MRLMHALRILTSRVKINGWASNISDRYCCTTSSKNLFSKNLEGVQSKVLSYGESHFYCSFRGYHDARYQIQHERATELEESPDPFSLVADELATIAERLRQMVVSEVPLLDAAAQYFFKTGVEGKRFRPTVLLLMASALNMPPAESLPDGVFYTLSKEIRARQQTVAAIIEMIHVASLIHDDVLDNAETRRGIKSLNFAMGNQIAIHSGKFLISRAVAALAALRNTEVMTLLTTVIGHLVKGETMQMTTVKAKRYSMEYYMQKTYYKTASLISISCKAIALLAGQTTEVSQLAYEYGRNLGLAFQLIDDLLDFTGTSSSLGKGSLSDIQHGIVTAPILFAMEEFPQLYDVIERGFDDQSNIDTVLQYLEKSQGIQRTTDLAVEHAARATQAILSLPESDDENVMVSRRALTSLIRYVIDRDK